MFVEKVVQEKLLNKKRKKNKTAIENGIMVSLTYDYVKS